MSWSEWEAEVSTERFRIPRPSSRRPYPSAAHTGPQRASPRRRAQLPVRAPPCPRTLCPRAPARSRARSDARPPQVLPRAVTPAYGARPPRVLPRAVAHASGASSARVPVLFIVRTWRQPPRGSSPTTPGSAIPSPGVSAKILRGRVAWTIRVQEFCLPLKVETAGAASLPLGHAPTVCGATPGHSPPYPCRTSRASRRGSTQRVFLAAPDSKRQPWRASKPPREAPGRPRAGRPFPPVRAAAVRPWR